MIKMKKRELNKQISQRKKEQKELNRLKMKKLKEINDMKKKNELGGGSNANELTIAQKMKIIESERAAATQRACQSVLDFVIAELEEKDWIAKVPQPPRKDLYYSTLRYVTNALNRSRLVNIPKTQAMSDYASLSKQWYENFEDRLDGANDLIMKAAAYQVLY